MAVARRPLAILGGTFDPIHLGHLRVAWEAAQALDAELRLMPANVPPHRPQPVASAAQRLAIIRASLLGQDRLSIDERELARAGRSYSIDTVIDLRREIGSQRPLVLLVGSDAFAGLASWHRWRELFEHAHVGVLTRPGSAAALPVELAAEYRQRVSIAATQWAAKPHGFIIDIAVTALDISATRIRQLLANAAEPRYLVADGVLADAALLAPYRDAAVADGGSIENAGDGPLSADSAR